MSHVRNCLDLSTAHVSRETMDLLEAVGFARTDGTPYDGSLSVKADLYGCFVHVPEAELEETLTDGDLPGDLQATFKLARENGCDYVLFDADGPAHPDLEVFEW